MARLIWTQQAVDDLNEVLLFLGRSGRPAGLMFMARIEESLEQLVSFPRSGAVVPELGDADVRQLAVMNYRLIYRLLHGAETVEIGAIIHGARRLDAGSIS